MQDEMKYFYYMYVCHLGLSQICYETHQLFKYIILKSIVHYYSLYIQLFIFLNDSFNDRYSDVF